MADYKRFWKFFIRNKNWCDSKFKIHATVRDQCSEEILYCGITILGVSFIYSDVW